MKPVPLDITREGSLGGQVIGMTLDTNSLSHIMSVLTDLYSDPIAAFIREYSTNARDAHIDAGKGDVPIEISLPNSLSPYFKVRDYGKGMSVDFIENVYSQYGNSTKRETNDQIGMLGLGGKSGLTYCAQFRIVSIHQGIKAQIMVSKNQDGAGEMEIVDTAMTEEPDGVEVIIPVHNYHEVNDKARHFFSFWKPGTVIIDDERPDFIGDNSSALWLSDDILVMPSNGNGGNESFVVMGNVPYKADGLVEWYSGYKVIAFVPVGSVSFPPNREELMYTEATKATIKDYHDRAAELLEKTIQAVIDKSENYVEALKTAEAYKNMYAASWTYKGEKLIDRWDFNYSDNPELAEFHPRLERHSVKFPQHITWKDFDGQLTVTGFPEDFTTKKVGTPIRQRIRKYIEDNGLKLYKVFLVTGHPDKERLPDIPVVSLDVIKAIKLEAPKRGDGSMKKFATVNSYGYRIEKDELESDKEVLYIVPGRRKIKWSNFAPLLNDYNIVTLYKGDVQKLLKAYPGAEDLETYVKDKFAIAKASLTKADRMAIADVDYYSRNLAQILDKTRIDDPDVVAYIEYIQGRSRKSDELTEYYQAAEYLRALGQYVGQLEAEAVDDPFDKYPLAKYHYGNTEHVIIYMNAVYQYTKEKNNQV